MRPYLALSLCLLHLSVTHQSQALSIRTDGPKTVAKKTIQSSHNDL